MVCSFSVLWINYRVKMASSDILRTSCNTEPSNVGLTRESAVESFWGQKGGSKIYGETKRIKMGVNCDYCRGKQFTILCIRLRIYGRSENSVFDPD